MAITTGTAWHSGVTEDQAMSYARVMYGPGYRVSAVRSKPDVALGDGVLLLVRWEVVDADRVRDENERRMARLNLTGAAAQAATYLD